MRKIILLLLLVQFISCKEEPRKGESAACAGGAVPALALGINRETNILTSNYWVIEFYVAQGENFEPKKVNRGKWYKFNKDGTFQSGHWEVPGCSGTWRLDYSTQYPMFIVDSYNDAEDWAWHMQGVTEDNSEMSLVGAQGYSNYADLVKAINLLTPPTKKQFGDE
ncbi:MAG: hypothetical protein SFU99_17655 [Saprospiraceae bacterium]|nr:hypothetical protein [Saprospiraceae bacterium]